MFITSPGIAELDLQKALRKLGIEADMWPRFDAYDLRVPLPGGPTWAVDVKDWANPALLARTLRPFRPDPPYDRAFLVVPEYRVRAREDYVRVFDHHLQPKVRRQIELCTDRNFLKKVKSEIRRLRSAGLAEEGADA